MNQEKRGRGRPKKDDSQKSVNHHLSFTSEHWATLQRLADERGISVSKLILQLASLSSILLAINVANSGYYPNVSGSEEKLSVNETTHYAKKI